MMASMAQTFTPHPGGGGMQHPPPGHPMAAAPGMAHNPSQPGAQPGMPHQLVGHMGVSGGPGAQINPAALMGAMPAGAVGPNAHAMQHLNPAAAAQAQQLFQQQQLNPMFANNPAIQQQLQQQRFQQIQQQQQQRQALMAQQAGYGGGMPMGMPISQLTPAQSAQYAAMRSIQQQRQQQQQQQQQQGQQANPHAQIMAQQLALQQQQMAANNQMQHGANPNQAAQMSSQQIQHAQLQVAMAQAQAQQQHAQAQAAAQTQAGQAQQAQGQPGQPQPQTPQQQPVQGIANASGPPQTQAQTPGQTPAQAGPQAPGPVHLHAPTPQQAQAAQQAQLAQAQQQQQAAAAAMTNNMLQQQKREGMKGHCLLKLMQFGEHLSGFPGSQGKDDLSYWNDFVLHFFSPGGMFRYRIHVTDLEQSADKVYEITYPALARYFYTHFDSGVKTMQLILGKGIIDRPMPGDGHCIENKEASLVYWFEGGSHLVATGMLRAQFDSEQKIELFEFLTTSHDEYISRRLVIEAAKPAHNWVKEWHKVNSDPKQSPEMSKKGKSRMMKSPQNPPPDLDLPQSAVKQSMGITEAVRQFLEIVEIIGQMNPLFGFYHANPGMAPYAALDQFNQQIKEPGQVAGVGMGVGMGVGGPHMGQAGPRTPSFSQFPMGASPAAPMNAVLPGSPHIGGSPAPGQMQAPTMQMQASQQGTSSSGPSANTSPAASNKRRRASAVKNEEDTPGSAPTPAGAGTPQINGIQKKPPTPRMPKRAKGNPPA